MAFLAAARRRRRALQLQLAAHWGLRRVQHSDQSGVPGVPGCAPARSAALGTARRALAPTRTFRLVGLCMLKLELVTRLMWPGAGGGAARCRLGEEVRAGGFAGGPKRLGRRYRVQGKRAVRPIGALRSDSRLPHARLLFTRASRCRCHLRHPFSYTGHK